MTVDPSKRASPAELLSYPFLKQLSNEAGNKIVREALKKEISIDIRSNLAELMKATQFQKTMVTYMNSLNLNLGELDSLRKKFEEVDTNSDGSLEMKEIKELMVLTLGNESFEEYEKFLQQIDTDSSGKINYSEFLSMISSKKNLLTD